MGNAILEEIECNEATSNSLHGSESMGWIEKNEGFRERRKYDAENTDSCSGEPEPSLANGADANALLSASRKARMRRAPRSRQRTSINSGKIQAPLGSFANRFDSLHPVKCPAECTDSSLDKECSGLIGGFSYGLPATSLCCHPHFSSSSRTVITPIRRTRSCGDPDSDVHCPNSVVHKRTSRMARRNRNRTTNQRKLKSFKSNRPMKESSEPDREERQRIDEERRHILRDAQALKKYAATLFQPGQSFVHKGYFGGRYEKRRESKRLMRRNRRVRQRKNGRLHNLHKSILAPFGDASVLTPRQLSETGVVSKRPFTPSQVRSSTQIEAPTSNLNLALKPPSLDVVLDSDSGSGSGVNTAVASKTSEPFAMKSTLASQLAASDAAPDFTAEAYLQKARAASAKAQVASDGRNDQNEDRSFSKPCGSSQPPPMSRSNVDPSHAFSIQSPKSSIVPSLQGGSCTDVCCTGVKPTRRQKQIVGQQKAQQNINTVGGRYSLAAAVVAQSLDPSTDIIWRNNRQMAAVDYEVKSASFANRLSPSRRHPIQLPPVSNSWQCHPCKAGCAVCGANLASYRCARCLSHKYRLCSKECQVKDYKRHKQQDGCRSSGSCLLAEETEEAERSEVAGRGCLRATQLERIANHFADKEDHTSVSSLDSEDPPTNKKQTAFDGITLTAPLRHSSRKPIGKEKYAAEPAEVPSTRSGLPCMPLDDADVVSETLSKHTASSAIAGSIGGLLHLSTRSAAGGIVTSGVVGLQQKLAALPLPLEKIQAIEMGRVHTEAEAARDALEIERAAWELERANFEARIVELTENRTK